MPNDGAKRNPSSVRVSELEELIAGLRAAFDVAEPQFKATLSKEIRAARAELVELAPQRGNSVDDLAKQRQARRAKADVVEAPARQGRKRRSGSD